MKIEVKLTAEHESYIIKNMYPLYLHDLSGHYGLVAGHMPNRHGIFEDSDEYKTLQDQYDMQNIWWEKQEHLYPFLITVDCMPAGFALIASPPYSAEGIDYFVHEFFVLQPFRGTGVAQYAAAYLFNLLKGRWQLFTNPSPKNIVGQKFWKRMVSEYSHGNFEHQYGTTQDGDKLIFTFHSEMN